MPKPGLAKLMFGNMGGGEVAVTINKQTIKIAAGAGGPQSPKGPTLDLPPGKIPVLAEDCGRPCPIQPDRDRGRRNLGPDDCAKWRGAAGADVLI
jgi:hypothetical protein